MNLARKSDWRRFVLPTLCGALGLLLAGTHLGQRLSARNAIVLDVALASPTSFQQEVPRQAELIIRHADGTNQIITSRRYGSAFLDPRSVFRFEFDPTGAAEILFKPAAPEQLVAIQRISVCRPGDTRSKTISLENLEPVAQVEVLERIPERLILKTTAGAAVPLCRLRLESFPRSDNAPSLPTFWIEAAAILTLGLLLATIFWRTKPLFEERPLFLTRIRPAVACLLTLAVVLIATMALRSRFNAHPDEYLHFESAKYFATHWLPPALNDPAVEPSFSHYGVSYLQDLDGAYLLAGRFMAMIPEGITSLEIASRLFNVILFGLVAAWVAGRLSCSRAAFVLLISPQIWYVFSYINADAWPLALSFLIVVQLAAEDSLLNRYLRSKRLRDGIVGGLALGALLALLLMAKRNFYLLFPFVLLVAAWRITFWHNQSPPLRVAAKWALVFAAAAALYLPIRVGHEALNGFVRPSLQTEQAEKFAAPRYRPSDIAAGEGAGALNVRSRGASLLDLVVEMGWARRSYESFCGVYHWMTLNSPPAYYLYMGALYVALLAFLFLAICRSGWQNALFAAGVFALVTGMIMVSAWHSWTGDFQPQGRYLFPVLPMVAFLFHQYRHSLRSKAFDLLFVGLFAGSVFSFVFTGLRQIPH